MRKIYEIKKQRYQYYILDFGLLSPPCFSEFEHCDHKMVLVNAALWKLPEFEKFAYQINKNNISWDKIKIILMGGIKEDYTRFYKNYGISAIPMPFFKNPFKITSGNFSFFEKLLKGE